MTHSNSQRTRATICQLISLNHATTGVLLQPEIYIPYYAGQYLQILLADESLSYSIANAPDHEPVYELQIRAEPGHSKLDLLFDNLHKAHALTIELPFGACHSHALTANPLFFIAGGTGFAPIKAIIEHQLENASTWAPFDLFWLTRSPADLYLETLVDQWQNQNQLNVARFFSAAVLKDNLLTKLSTIPLDLLTSYQFVVSGPFEMAWFIYDILVEAGINQQQIHSDAFSFPREIK